MRNFKIYQNLRKIIFFIVICFPYIVFSQNSINFEHLTIEDGLSQSTIKCILQDSDGFIWYGTADGLNKYNGYEMETFRHSEDSTSIPNNTINTIYEDSQKNIWLGIFKTGLCKYNKITETFTLFTNEPENDNSISSNVILSICEDDNSFLWLATTDGLNKFNPKTNKNKRFYEKDGLCSNFIYKIVKDKHGNLWIATRSGLNFYNSKKQKFITIKNVESNFSDKKIRDICISEKNQKLWLGTSTGLYSLDLQKFYDKNEVQVKYYEQKNNNIIALIEDFKENIWIGTKNSGISIFYTKIERFKNYQNNPFISSSLSVNNITSVIEDESHIIWIGTALGGVNKYNRIAKPFHTYRNNPLNPNSLSSNQLRCIFEDKTGVVWLGTKSGGLIKWLSQENKFISYKTNPSNLYSIKDNYVRTIFQDNEGRFWVGTDKAGLLEFDPKTERFIKQYKHNPKDSTSISCNKIWKIIQDSKGNIWVATFGGGLNLFEPKTGKFKIYKNEPGNKFSISDDEITTIYEDKNNNLWIGTYNGGLNLFNPETEKFIRYAGKSKDKNYTDRIYCITENKKGELWISAEGNLKKYETKKNSFVEYNYIDLKFPNSTLMSLLEDNNNNFWISTNNGLIKFNYETQKCKTFYAKDGLQSNEFMIGAYCKTSKGNMIFGGINGFNVFIPNEIINNPHIPNVVITDFKILNKKTDLDSNISIKKILKLEYHDNEFSFNFVALDYAQSESNQYAYMLEGHDDNWIYCETRRFVSYTNLNPGKYTFKVKAANNDGVWNEKGTQIRIIIKPPFWKTKWFIIIILLLVIAIIFAIIKYRDIARDKTQLEGKVQERTIQIRQQNEEISSQLEQIDKQKNKLHKAYKNVRLLSEIGKKITSNLSIPEIIKTTHENINMLMDAKVFAIGIYNKPLQRLDFKGAKEQNNDLPDFKIKINEKDKLAIWTFDNKKVILINDYDKEFKNYINKKTLPVTGENNAKSIIYQPILSNNECIGVISVQSFEKNKYTNNHVSILKNLAIYIAIALDNTHSFEQIERQKRNITDSIFYAKRIQEAILPPKELMDKLLQNYFLYFKPRDIVSGDFYWIKKINPNKVSKNLIRIIAVADCTGHGVPGAFMSMLGISLLKEIVSFYEKNLTDLNQLNANMILNDLRDGIIEALHQTGKINEPQDGMDIALAIINEQEKMLKFAGANNPLFYFRKNKNDDFQFNEIKSDKIPIGYFLGKKSNYQQNILNIKPNDTIYFFSDGYTDQLGGKNERKFLKKRFKKLLLSIQNKSMDEQKKVLNETFNKWISYKNSIGENYEQLDDILILGIKF